jgi:hypothetical protein
MKLLYKPVGLAIGALSGVLAGAVFKRLWRLTMHEAEAPRATARDKGWSEVIAAAALQGAVFAGVKALVDRAGATWFEKITGTWPDDATGSGKSAKNSGEHARKP